jgi:hypothetical protein
MLRGSFIRNSKLKRATLAKPRGDDDKKREQRLAVTLGGVGFFELPLDRASLRQAF